MLEILKKWIVFTELNVNITVCVSYFYAMAPRSHIPWKPSQRSLFTALPHLNSPEPWFNIKMSSYQYSESHCGDKTVVRSSYLHNGISYTGEMASLYWTNSLISSRYSVMPLLSADLCQVIQRITLTGDHIQFLVYQMFRGLKYIHSAGIIHRVCQNYLLLLACLCIGIKNIISIITYIMQYKISR